MRSSSSADGLRRAQHEQDAVLHQPGYAGILGSTRCPSRTQVYLGAYAMGVAGLCADAQAAEVAIAGADNKTPGIRPDTVRGTVGSNQKLALSGKLLVTKRWQVAVNTSRGLVRFEAFELDLRAGELRKEGATAVRLSEQPFRILTMLLEHAGEVVTREEIRKKLWPNDTIVEFEHSISAAMNRLRQALGDSADNPRYIETLARRGYRLLVPVEWLKAPSDSESSAASSPEDSSAPDSTLDGRPSLGRADLSVNSAELRADLE